jgi:hypothetical protein
MSDIFAEIDSALQRDRLEGLWRSYGGLVIVGVFGLILATAVNSGWQAWQRHDDTKKTAAILTVRQDKDPLAALLSLSEKTDHQHRRSILMNAASLAVKAGKIPQAIDLYDGIFKDSKNARDQILPYLYAARLRHASGALNEKNAPEIVTQLMNFGNNPDLTLRWQCLYQASLILLDVQKDPVKAKALLTQITEAGKDTAMPSLRQKAQALIEVIHYDYPEKKENKNAKSDKK